MIACVIIDFGKMLHHKRVPLGRNTLVQKREDDKKVHQIGKKKKLEMNFSKF